VSYPFNEHSHEQTIYTSVYIIIHMSKKVDNILALFVEEPDRKFNVREAARILKINPSTASKYLNQLAREGLLIKKKERNLILYSADTESRKFRDFKIYYNIKKIRESGLVDFLEKEMNYPETIVLFGSYVKGENTKRSDIDLFILSASEVPDLKPFQKKLEAEIQIFVHSRKEIEQMKIKNKELLNNIINGIRLSGFFEVFR